MTDVWKTLYTSDFNIDKYLYHYTSFNSALKILDTDSLLFSQITKTNDPSESKIKIVFPSDNEDYGKYEEKITAITDYFTEYSKLVQLLCLCMDTHFEQDAMQNIILKMNNKDRYYNISGRGFALPRMWAQYGENNNGVCFIINKEKLLKLVSEKFVIKKTLPVTYKPFYEGYFMSSETMNNLMQKISSSANGAIVMQKLIDDDDDFLKNNFFVKNENWSNENEFRILILVSEQTALERACISGFSSCLKGIVLGEQIDNTNERIIRLFIKALNLPVDVKRIKFNNRLYKLI